MEFTRFHIHSASLTECAKSVTLHIWLTIGQVTPMSLKVIPSLPRRGLSHVRTHVRIQSIQPAKSSLLPVIVNKGYWK